MIIDGKKIAEEIIVELGTKLKGKRLGFVMAEGNAASASFVRMKERIANRLGVVVVQEAINDTAEAIRAVERLITETDGLIVQLPLPAQVDTEAVLKIIPSSHDVDAENPDTKSRLVRAPVAEAISEIFVRTGVATKGKKAVVVGKGRLVGAPAAEFLKSLGAQVTVITQTQGSLEELQDADILVLGAGEPGLVGPDMVKEGVVLIDAGTTEDKGRIAGDAQPGCAHVASVFTPVPGGVGPIAVAMIFKNLLALARKK